MDVVLLGSFKPSEYSWQLQTIKNKYYLLLKIKEDFTWMIPEKYQVKTFFGTHQWKYILKDLSPVVGKTICLTGKVFVYRIPIQKFIIEDSQITFSLEDGGIIVNESNCSNSKNITFLQQKSLVNKHQSTRAAPF